MDDDDPFGRPGRCGEGGLETGADDPKDQGDDRADESRLEDVVLDEFLTLCFQFFILFVLLIVFFFHGEIPPCIKSRRID